MAIAVGLSVTFDPTVSPAAGHVPNSPDQQPRDDFASSAACRSCHPSEHASWARSFHSAMTQRPSDASIQPPWTGEIGPARMRSKLWREGAEFWATTPDFAAIYKDQEAARKMPKLPMLKRRIVLVTGSHHKQVFWYATERNDGNELEVFPYLWLIEDQRWAPRDAAFLRPTFWPPRPAVGRWNTQCIQCHTTGGRPRLPDAPKEPLQTDVVDFGIGCESCHGPAQQHAERMRNPATRLAARVGLLEPDTITRPEKLSPSRTSDACGICHAQAVYYDDQAVQRVNKSGQPFRPGDELDKHMHVIDPHESPDTPRMKRLVAANPVGWHRSYWADGMIKMGGRELSALRLAPCAKPGHDQQMHCLSCHQMHEKPENTASKRQQHGRGEGQPSAEDWRDDQLQPGMRGDQACTQCHKDPALQSTEHTHHPPNSEGARCMNCHMPHATYTLLKATRNHMVSSPNAKVAQGTGRPDACSLCHLDKPPGWTATHLPNWYKQPIPDLPELHRRVPGSMVWGLSGDALQRALITWHLGWRPAQAASGTDWMPLLLSQRILDPYSAVRYLARRSLRTLPGYSSFDMDFIDAPRALNSKALQVFTTWRQSTLQQGDPTQAGTQTTLYRGRFTIQKRDWDKLLKSRNDEPVELPE